MKDFGSTYIQTNESLTLKLVINLSFFLQRKWIQNTANLINYTWNIV